MNVVIPGVSAELDLIVIVLTILSLIGTAMMLLLAWAKTPSFVTTVAIPMPAAQSRAQLALQLRSPQLAQACGTTRAPPPHSPLIQSASLRARARS
jgi:hypothetical protein